MKKFISIVISVALMVSLFSALSVFADETATIKTLDEFAPAGFSFDTVYGNGTYGVDATVYVDGGAGAWLKTNGGDDHYFPNTDGAIKTLGLRGWVGFDQEIDAFGFQVNDGVCYFGNFATAAEKPVLDAGGQYAKRYAIIVPVLAFPGENKFTACVRLADGTIVKFDKAGDEAGKAFVKLTNPEAEIIENAEFVDWAAAPMSWDFNYWNGAQLNPGYKAEGTEGEGPENSGLPYNFLKQFLNEDGSLTTAAYDGRTYGAYGWIGAEDAVTKVGYFIGNKVYFDGYGSYWDAESGVVDAVKANGVSNEKAPLAKRFNVQIPLCLVNGSEKAGLVAKLESGKLMILNSQGMNDTTIVFNDAANFDPASVVVDPVDDPTDEPQNPGTSDVSLVIFVIAAAAIALVVLKKRAF